MKWKLPVRGPQDHKLKSPHDHGPQKKPASLGRVLAQVKQADKELAEGDRKPRTIYIGVTANGNVSVGGWLPFVVDLSPIYGTMRVHGTLFTDHRSGVFDSRDEAMRAALQKAMDSFAFNGDTIEEVVGCHRCWNEKDAAHLKWIGDAICCGTCGRELKSRSSA